MTRNAFGIAALSFSSILFATTRADAYRPFDGTDADVAEHGQFELEIGPTHYLGQGHEHYLVAPATVLNLGIFERWELVVDFSNYIGLDAVPGQSRVRLLDTDVLLKYVFKEGSIQEGHKGISLAAEFGPLTPNIHGEDGLGGQMNIIASHEYQRMAMHWNNTVAYTRAHFLDVFESVIVEGSRAHDLRPVAEVFVEHDWSEGGVSTYSGLIGALWRSGDALTFDLGLRAARQGDQNIGEVRFGLTWGFAVWEPRSSRPPRF